MRCAALLLQHRLSPPRPLALRKTPTFCSKADQHAQHAVIGPSAASASAPHQEGVGELQVPWPPARFGVAFSQIICLQLALAYGSVGVWAGISGLPVDSTTSDQVDVVLLLSDVLQLLGVLAIIRLSLQPQPLQQQQEATQAPSPSSPQGLQGSLPTQEAPAIEAPHGRSPTTQPIPRAAALRYTLDAEALAIGAAAAAAALLCMSLLAQLPGAGAGAEPEVSLLLQTSSPVGRAALLLSTVVVGPITEELVWRGLLLPSLSSWMASSTSALAISSLAFAAYHLSWQDLPSLTILGASLGYAMTRSGGNLMAPTLGHALYNLAALAALGPAAWGVQQAHGS